MLYILLTFSFSLTFCSDDIVVLMFMIGGQVMVSVSHHTLLVRSGSSASCYLQHGNV